MSGDQIFHVLLTLISAVAAGFAAWLAHQNRQKIAEVHTIVNSRLDALLENVRAAAHVAGVLAEKERDKQRRGEGP